MNPENPDGPGQPRRRASCFRNSTGWACSKRSSTRTTRFLRRGRSMKPIPQQRARFEQQLDRAESLAKASLSRDPQDRDALLAMTLASGPALRLCRAYRKAQPGVAALHQRSDGLGGATARGRSHLLRRSPGQRRQPLHRRVDGGAGALDSAPRRRLRRQSRAASPNCRPPPQHGQLLAPFARILLAIAYVREKESCRRLARLLVALQQRISRTTRSLAGTGAARPARQPLSGLRKCKSRSSEIHRAVTFL